MRLIRKHPHFFLCWILILSLLPPTVFGPFALWAQQAGTPSSGARCSWNSETQHCHCEVPTSRPRQRCETVDGHTSCWTMGGEFRTIDRDGIPSNDACMANIGYLPQPAPEETNPDTSGSQSPTTGGGGGGGEASTGTPAPGCEDSSNPFCVSGRDLDNFRDFRNRGLNIAIGNGGPGGVEGGLTGALFGTFVAGPVGALYGGLLGSHVINPWYNRRREVQADEDRRNLEGARAQSAQASSAIEEAYSSATTATSASLNDLEMSHRHLSERSEAMASEDSVATTENEASNDSIEPRDANRVYSELGRSEAVIQEAGKPLGEAIENKGLATEAMVALKQLRHGGSAIFNYAKGFVQAHPVVTEMVVTFAVTMNPMADLALATAQAISVFTTDRTLFGNPAETTTDKVLAVAGVIFPIAQLKNQIGAFARARNGVHATAERVRTILFPRAREESIAGLAQALNQADAASESIVAAKALAESNTNLVDVAVRAVTRSSLAPEFLLKVQRSGRFSGAQITAIADQYVELERRMAHVPLTTYDGPIARAIEREGPGFLNTESSVFQLSPRNRELSHRYSIEGNEAIYTSIGAEARATAVAETGLAESALIIATERRQFQRVLDLTDPAVREHLGIPGTSNLIEEAYIGTQQIGDLAQKLNFDAIIAPSSLRLRSGWKNLIILRP